ncbi:hypothetical protein YC2023_116345 [Brassica napus]
MVRVDDEFLRPKIVLPCLKSPHQCIQLLVIGGVVERGSTKIFTEIGNGSPILHQHNTNTNSGGITFDFKSLRKIRKYK